MMENVVDKKIDGHLIQQVNKMSGRNSTGANKYFKRLKLDYPQQETSRASRRFVRAMKKLEVRFTILLLQERALTCRAANYSAKQPLYPQLP